MGVYRHGLWWGTIWKERTRYQKAYLPKLNIRSWVFAIKRSRGRDRCRDLFRKTIGCSWGKLRWIC